MSDSQLDEIKYYAESGEAWAQYLLGCHYESINEPKKAFICYADSAQQDYGLAMFEVAECYFYGYAVDKNINSALEWYYMAEDQLLDSEDEDERKACAEACYKIASHMEKEAVYNHRDPGAEYWDEVFVKYRLAVNRKHGLAAYHMARVCDIKEVHEQVISYADKAIAYLEEELSSNEFGKNKGLIMRAALSDAIFLKLRAEEKLNRDREVDEDFALSYERAAYYGHPVAAVFGGSLLYQFYDKKDVAYKGFKFAIENFDTSVWKEVLRQDGSLEIYTKYVGECEKWVQILEKEGYGAQNNIISYEEKIEKKYNVNEITHESLLKLSLLAKNGDKSAVSELNRQMKMLAPDINLSDEKYRKVAPFVLGIKCVADHEDNSEASYHLATCYHYGNGVEKSLATAKSYYENAVNFIEIDKNGTVETLKASIKGLNAIQKELGVESELVYPATYGTSTFNSFDEIIDNIDVNPDALGLYSQCSIFGLGVVKRGTLGFDGLFEAANAGSTDAVLGLGRLYEIGYDFIARDTDAALQLYKYAYSLKNIDALHSLGFILFTTFNKKEIGLAMMKKAAELGSKDASNQLEFIKDDVDNIKSIPFDCIAKSEFEYDEFVVADSLRLYNINLQDKQAVKDAMIDVMSNMKPDTYSAIMNQFRVKYLRRRKLMHFMRAVNFLAIFEELVKDGLVTAEKVNDYGVVENTLYILKNSAQKMKSTTLDWDDL